MQAFVTRHIKSVTVIFTISLLIIMRVAAPVVIEKLINQRLSATNGISGYIKDIDLALYKGGYKIKGLTLFLQQHPKDSPNIYIETLDLSISWSALLRGDIVANAEIFNSEFRFIDEQATDNRLKEEVIETDTWLTLINYATPISIDKVSLHNNKVILTNKTAKNTHTSYLDNIYGEITNITNSRDFSGKDIAHFNITGMLMSKAKVSLFGSLNPSTPLPTFDINLEMQRLPVVELDNFIRFYTPFDVEKGDVDTAIELVADNGKVEGYAKAGIYDVNVFTWKQDIKEDGDNIFTGLFEGLVDIFATIFEANKKDLVAVNVPITGTIENTKISTWQALLSLFHNAFIHAYEIKIDDILALDDDPQNNH